MGHHRVWSYKFRVMKTRCLITRPKRHVRAIPISAEEYLRKEISKANINKLIDCIAQINRHEYLSNIKMGVIWHSAKDSATSKAHKHRTLRRCEAKFHKNIKDKHILNKQTHNQETVTTARLGQINKKPETLLLLDTVTLIKWDVYINRSWRPLLSGHCDINQMDTFTSTHTAPSHDKG